MKKLIALTGITALLVLTGCGQDTPDAKPAKAAPEQAEPTAEATTEAPESTLVWEVQDPDTWAKYTIDFTEYHDNLTNDTDAALVEAGAPEVQWGKASIDNTEGRDTGTLGWAEIVVVDGNGDQYYPTADAGETVDEALTDYQDGLLDTDTEGYNALIDLSNEWMEAEAKADAMPGAETERTILIDELPDTIDRVYLNNNEMTPVK